MGRKKIYSETKNKLNLSLTETAIKWLETKQAQLTATSLSDAIERMAREQNEVSCPPDNEEEDQTLKLNSEDSEALVEALLNPPSPNKALLAAAARYQQIISA